LNLARNLNYKVYIIWSLLIKAAIYNTKGEVFRALPLYEKSLEVAKEINHIYFISLNYNNMADAYRMQGDLEQAIECS
jgi:tetratricopeptide (TPR) repeat protein